MLSALPTINSAEGVAVDGKVELVLDSDEKSLRRLSLCAVIHRGGVNVGNLLIEATLAGAVPNPVFVSST